MRNYKNYVKKLAVLVMAILIGLPAMAQDDKKQINTLFGGDKGHISHGGWGGLYFGYTKIKDKDTYLMGARGGWLINHRLTIGLAGSGFITDRQYDILVNEGAVNLAGGYGGLFLEAVIFPFSPVHITIPLTIGAGGVAYTRSAWWDDDDYHGNYTIASDAYFVIEPGLEIEFNLIKFMRTGNWWFIQIYFSHRHD